MQCRLPFLREPNENFTVIRFRRYTLHHSVLRQPVYQLNGAVMANQHSQCEFTNGRFNAIWQAFDGQQELVLLRLDSVCACLIFAEPQETADLVTKFSQILQLSSCKLNFSCGHIPIVTRYISTLN